MNECKANQELCMQKCKKGPKCSFKNLQDLNAMQRMHADMQKLKTGSNMQFQKTMGP